MNRKHLTAAQQDILLRLANGDEMTQDWVTATCKWKKNNAYAPRQTIDSFQDKGYIKSTFWHYSDSGRAQLYIEITPAGIAALEAK